MSSDPSAAVLGCRVTQELELRPASGLQGQDKERQTHDSTDGQQVQKKKQQMGRWVLE